MNNNIDLTKETPKDQQWISYPKFEKQLYQQGVSFPKAKAITNGPNYHWFGYYDKFQTNPADRYVLGMQAHFDDHSPSQDDSINIGIIDLQNNNKWIGLGSTCAWCWQQGCMLQWRPNSDDEILWNDKVKDKFVCHLLNINTGKVRTLDHPVYHVSPDGKNALVLDFARIQSVRPGYGYPGIADVNQDTLRPEESGVWLQDIDTGQMKFLLSIADVAAVDYTDSDPIDDKHYFNHDLYKIFKEELL